MPDRPVAPAPRAPARAAAAADEPDAADGGDAARRALRAGWRAGARMLASRPVRWGFIAVTVALGGYAVARGWSGVRTSLGHLGFLPVVAALISVLMGLFATMLVWRLLLEALGSPLPVRAAARIMFIGQLGKYLPGSVWPVLAQMELGNAYRVPGHRPATAP